MHRLGRAAVLVFALLLAAQLTLHNHSLIPEGGGVPALACSVCAFGADRSTLDTPLFAAALALVGLITAQLQTPVVAERRLARAGRAPPAR